MKTRDNQPSRALAPARRVDEAAVDATATAGKASPLPTDEDYRYAASLAHRHPA